MHKKSQYHENTNSITVQKFGKNYFFFFFQIIKKRNVLKFCNNILTYISPKKISRSVRKHPPPQKRIKKFKSFLQKQKIILRFRYNDSQKINSFILNLELFRILLDSLFPVKIIKKPSFKSCQDRNDSQIIC